MITESSVKTQKEYSAHSLLYLAILIGVRWKDDNIENDYYQLTQYSLVHSFALSGMHIHILYILLLEGFYIISL